MDIRTLTEQWFNLWEKGDFLNLPITENFSHTSPFGTIDGKEAYLSLIKENQDKFLGHHFKIHDQLFDENRACVRYTAIQEDFKLDVSEWHYANNEGTLIESIHAYYHIGEIRGDRKLSDPDQ